MNQIASTHPLSASALERLRHWWGRLALSVFPGLGATETDRATARIIAGLKPLLERSRTQGDGEVSARQRADRIAAVYRNADIHSRAAILNLITHEFAPDRAELESAISAIRLAANDVELSQAEARLRLALDAPRATFLAQFNLLPEGVKFLVDLRSEERRVGKECRSRWSPCA